MATTFERDREELVHYLASRVVIDEATRHYEHIGIVVLTNELPYLRVPAYSGSNALMLVESH